jgi:hypothetical protein
VEEQQNLTWLSQIQYQAGVVSRQQALDAGFTEKAIECRLRSGAWRRLYRGVYATFTGDLSRDARLWAAVLWAGPGVVLSHETAAEIQHLTDKPSQRIHISVPDEQHPGRRKNTRGGWLSTDRGDWLRNGSRRGICRGPPLRTPCST